MDGYSEIPAIWILSLDSVDNGGRVFGAFDSPEAAMKYFQIKYRDLRHLDWKQQDREYADAPTIYTAISSHGLDYYHIQQFDILSDEEIA